MTQIPLHAGEAPSRRRFLASTASLAGVGLYLQGCTEPGGAPPAGQEKQVTPKIDAHHHFWKYNAQEYGWMNDKMKAIQRDFLPPDLAAEIRRVGIDGVVSVQARQTVQETTELLAYGAQHDFIRGVVGWVPLTDPKVSAVLEKFAGNKLLKGVRHVVHDEPDDNYILRDDFNEGIDVLKLFGLTYDILIFEKHLPQTIQFVDRHPEQVFILDHLGKPKVKEKEMSPWKENIQELAKRPNVYCKISGLVTEADWTNWTEEELLPYMSTVLEAFGPNRCMFGSDWPVCLVAIKYERWFDIVNRFASKLPEAEYAAVMGGTAVKAYKL